MKENHSAEKEALLKGRKGFDEASYYLDNKHTLGFKNNDEELKEEIEHLFSDHKVFRKYDFFTTVQNGIVTVRGIVASPDEKKEVAFLVRQLDGVKVVINLLQS